MRRKLGPVIGLAVTCALLVYVVRQLDFHRVREELHRAASWTVPVIAVVVVLVYAADSVAMWKTFGWFAARMRLSEVLLVRGATYLLALVNYAVGQGAIVYFVRRTRGIPVARSSATVLLIMGTNVLSLLAFASVGVALSGAGGGAITTLVLVGYAGLAAYLFVIFLRPKFLTRMPLFDVLFEAGLSGHAKAFAVRVPHIASIILLQWIAMRAFRVQVPLLDAVMYLPVTLLAALVPSFLGLGPMQAMMIALMSKYADGGADVLAAATFTSWTIATVVQIAIALVCLRSQLTRDLSREVAAAS